MVEKADDKQKIRREGDKVEMGEVEGSWRAALAAPRPETQFQRYEEATCICKDDFSNPKITIKYPALICCPDLSTAHEPR